MLIEALTTLEGDVVAAVRRLQPAGHLLQDGDLTADDDVWLSDVHVHVGVGHLVGQSVPNHN